MADRKGTARARRSGSTQNIGWQRNKVNVALPLSMIKTEEPVAMRAGDWRVTGSAWLDWWSRSPDSALRSGNSTASQVRRKRTRSCWIVR